MGARRLAVGTAAAAALLGAGPADAHVHPNRSARVQGTFAMNVRITTAVNVRGEHKGERLKRTWRISPLGCHGRHRACRRLRLVRRRASGGRLTIVLRRHANGAYRGAGSFFVPLRCRGRTYPHGSAVGYLMTLRVSSSVVFAGVRYATSLRASYFNPSRSDITPCPLGPSHDAALYTGRFVSPAI